MYDLNLLSFLKHNIQNDNLIYFQYYGDDSDDDDKTYVGSRRSSPSESPRKVSKSRPIRRRSAKSDDEDSELEYPRRNSRRDSVELMKRKSRNKSRGNIILLLSF